MLGLRILKTPMIMPLIAAVFSTNACSTQQKTMPVSVDPVEPAGGGVATQPSEPNGVGLVVPIEWTITDKAPDKQLSSEEEDCYASGFNLKAIFAQLPKETNATLRSEHLEQKKGWVFWRDQQVKITIGPTEKIVPAQCLPPNRWPSCDQGGPCRLDVPQPLIVSEARLEWHINDSENISFTGVLRATPNEVLMLSNQEMAPPQGWTSAHAQYEVVLDANGIRGNVSGIGCAEEALCDPSIGYRAMFSVKGN